MDGRWVVQVATSFIPLTPLRLGDLQYTSIPSQDILILQSKKLIKWLTEEQDVVGDTSHWYQRLPWCCITTKISMIISFIQHSCPTIISWATQCKYEKKKQTNKQSDCKILWINCSPSTFTRSELPLKKGKIISND